MPGRTHNGVVHDSRRLLDLALIVTTLNVPVIADAGLGVPSGAARCPEAGAAAVLVNTAIARAENPPEMARAFAEAVVAGPPAVRARPAPNRLETVSRRPGGGGAGYEQTPPRRGAGAAAPPPPPPESA